VRAERVPLAVLLHRRARGGGTLPAMSSRDIARDVLLEALGSSATPFVPVPWVDDWLVARLLRRIAKKVLTRHGIEPSAELTRDIAEGFAFAGEKPFATRAAVSAVRFVVRKIAVVLDVKKSHDVFGQAIAFALALDAAIDRGVLRATSARDVGALLHRATLGVGSGTIDQLAGAVRHAFQRHASPRERASHQTRAERIADAVGAQIDEAQARLASALDRELQTPRR
jgi:hypothetical protein